MSATHVQSERQTRDRTPRISLRTLLLMLELLVAVAALQYLAAIKPIQAGALWLANDRPATMSAPAEAGAELLVPLAR